MCQRRVCLVEGLARLHWSLQRGRGLSARTTHLQDAGSALEKPLEEKVREDAETSVTVALGVHTARDSPKDRSHVCEDWAVLGTLFLVPKWIHTGSEGPPTATATCLLRAEPKAAQPQGLAGAVGRGHRAAQCP